MGKTQLHALDCFISGVPPRALFEGDLAGLNKLVEASNRFNDDEFMKGTTIEVCLIGLASYFEAFCKNQFAGVINICPKTLDSFIAKRDNVTVKLKDILKLKGVIEYQLGSLLAEEYDFGSAKSINSLFCDLQHITPFSRDEAKKYAEFLADRNLLVHHGGIYTLKYRERIVDKIKGSRVFMDSLEVNEEDYYKWADFIYGMVKKINSVSSKALQDFIQTNKIRLGKTKIRAKEFIIYNHEDDFGDLDIFEGLDFDDEGAA